jgi:pyrroloquinoline quinone biosynthesis protein E
VEFGKPRPVAGLDLEQDEKMIARREGSTLVIFAKEKGMTAEFSGAELAHLLTWCESSGADAFVHRLFRLGLIQDHAADAPVILAGYGKQREGIPRALHIDVTDYCPLSCRQCYRSSQAEYEHMTPSAFAAAVSEAEELGFLQIAIGGGEPLCHPQINELIACVGLTEMAVSLTTSGALPPQNDLAATIAGLRQAGLNHIQVSLNGSTEKTNSLSRDGYRQARALLAYLGDCKMSWGVNWTARTDNLHELEEVCDLAASLGADNVNVLRYKPSGNEDYMTTALSSEAEQALAARLRRVRGVNIKVDSAYSFLFHLLYDNVRTNTVGCAAGTGFVSLTTSGAFKPCSHLPDTSAWRGTGLRAYLSSPNYLDFLRAKAVPLEMCRPCRHLQTCGGCRAIAKHPEGYSLVCPALVVP